MGRQVSLWTVLGFLYAVCSLSMCVAASGRGLEQAVAVAVATSSSDGGPSNAVATADSTDGGVAESISTAHATDGGSATSVVNTEAGKGEVVKGNLTVVGANGADAFGKLDLQAEKDAIAVVNLLVAASGDKVVGVDVWAKGLKTYDGNVIALSLKKAYDESPEMGAYATRTLSIAFRDLVDAHPKKPAYLAKTIVSAIRRKDDAAIHFGGVLIYLFKEQGCGYIRPICLEAEALAASYSKDRAFIKAIAPSPELLQCVYSTPCDDIIVSQCCGDQVKAFGKCQCIGDECNYKRFWEGPQLIWKCVSDVCVDNSKCVCPLTT